MAPTLPWNKELARLDRAIRPIAMGKVDLDELDRVGSGPHPLDRAGIRAEAESLLLAILQALVAGPPRQRQAIRNLVEQYPNFFWAATPPGGATPEETLRRQLLLFALLDQYPDPRDAVLWLQEICDNSGVSPYQLALLRQEVAPVASGRSRYGFGSTRSMLLRGYGSSFWGYGQGGSPARMGNPS